MQMTGNQTRIIPVAVLFVINSHCVPSLCNYSQQITSLVAKDSAEESIPIANEDRATPETQRHRVCDQVLLVVVTYFCPRSHSSATTIHNILCLRNGIGFRKVL